MTGAAPRNLRVVTDAAQAASLVDPVRVALLARLREPGSASSLARELDVPRQRINYHLRELEKAGLVKLVEERRRGNCVERLVRATARSYLISPKVLGAIGQTPEEQQDRFSASHLLAAAARVVQQLSDQVTRATAARKRIATLTLEIDIRFASADDRTDFAEDLAAAIARLASKYHDAAAPGGRTMRLLVGAYPAPSSSRPPSRKGTSS